MGSTSSSNLGADWLLEQLQAALRLHAQVEPSMFVVERLASFAPEYPLATLACLELIVQGDVIGWGIESWKRHAVPILQSALANAGTTTRARALVNELGRRGFHEYRNLLEGGGGST
jgi:hypothetical protein